MGVLDSMKKKAAKTKKQGELVLINRELQAQKRKLGIELFTVLYQWEQQNEGKELPVRGLDVIYKAAKEEIMNYVEKKREKEEELDVIAEDKRYAATRAPSATTPSDQAKNAGHWISSTGSAAKLRGQIAYYEREIRLRKEIFGVQVFEEFDIETEAMALSISAAAAALEESSMMESEDAYSFSSSPPKKTDDDVVAVFSRTKVAVREILERRQKKEKEIAALFATVESLDD